MTSSNIKSSFILFSLFFSFLTISRAQSVSYNEISDSLRQKVDAIFAAMNNASSPGAALVIIKNGKIVYKNGYGIADLESGAKISSSTIFHVGSVSKQFTAMAIQLLVKEKKLSLDNDVRKYLPELHNFGKVITIRHLLNHTSGLREQLQLLFMAGWRIEDVTTQEDILRLIWRQRELNFLPGKEYLYSNTNYTLLALIAERASEKTLAQYTAEKIFKPLGMMNTCFRSDYRTITKNLALSYIPTSQGVRQMFLLGSYVGPSGLMTTAEDLALWDQNFYTFQVGGREVIERMLTAGKLNDGQKINYASGLNVGQYRGLKSIEHTGEDAGYQADFMQFPEQQFSVIILSNSGGFDVFSAVRKIADLYLVDEAAQTKNSQTPAPIEIKEFKISPKALDRFTGYYKLPFGISLKLVSEAGKLTAQIREQSKQILFSTSANAFSTKEGNIKIEFLPPEKGKYIKLKIALNGQNLEGEKIENLELTEPLAKEYAGEYYSEELETIYFVFSRDGKLLLSHRRGEESLAIKHEDEFTTGFSAEAKHWRNGEYVRIKFFRDKRNRIAGFLLSMPTARNVRFIKADRILQSAQARHAI